MHNRIRISFFGTALALDVDAMRADESKAIIAGQALWFEASEGGFAPLLEAIGDARFVLIGEASHGTQEFYDARAQLTKTLIREHGFTAVAVEADWPDAYRANRWVKGASDESDAASALGDFQRFPRWMWRNTTVVSFLTWLREENRRRTLGDRAGFYGLDLYSLHASMHAVLEYLQKVDPAAAERAKYRYGCFESFGDDPQAYGYAATIGLSRSCEDEVVAELRELQRHAGEFAARDGSLPSDAQFVAEQNARLVRNAEEYYRAMFGGEVRSWNLRDTHMMETLNALAAHLSRDNSRVRLVVWAHNSHLGDARATEMSARGELNLGQLVRQRHRGEAFLIGFTTHTGTVTAARNWDDPSEQRRVRPSIAGSYERLFHNVGIERFLLLMRDPALRAALSSEQLERAIGVIYRPDSERVSHYFRARLADQFDAVIHIDETTALEPLERWARHEADLPETYPSGV